MMRYLIIKLFHLVRRVIQTIQSIRTKKERTSMTHDMSQVTTGTI